MKSSSILPFIEPAMREAGRMLLKYWPGNIAYDNSLKVKQKSDGSLVTEADEMSEEIVLGAIARYFPNDAIYSEERISKGEQQEEYHSIHTWVVDPLDGTKSFVDGRNDFSILAARVHKGDPKFGAMYFPARSLFAYGEEGIGSMVNGIPIKVSTRAEIYNDRRICVRNVRFNAEGTTPEWVYPQWMDSGMAFLSVANGDFEGLILRRVHHQEWDVAAPLRIMKEAGGTITDGEGRDITIRCAPVDYQYFIASNGLVHDKLLEIVKNLPPQK